MSNIAQIGNLVPNWFPRVNYGPQGRPFTFPPWHDKAGQLEYVEKGSFKRTPPMREDNKMFLFNIYHDLEVALVGKFVNSTMVNGDFELT